MWDLSSADKASAIIPGLATEWKVDDKDRTKWVFKLRKGVKFHDGSDFNADAVVFNFDKVLKKDAPQYDPRLVAQTTPRMPTITGARKIDDYTGYDADTKTGGPLQGDSSVTQMLYSIRSAFISSLGGFAGGVRPLQPGHGRLAAEVELVGATLPRLG
jgi:hypothetical protein